MPEAVMNGLSYLGRLGLAGLFGIISHCSFFSSRCMAAALLDTSFVARVTTDQSGFASVTRIVRQPDGKVVLGGTFTSVNGVFRQNVARVHADGSLDLSFDAGTASDGVSRIYRQPDGKFVMMGAFGSVNRPGFARLNEDGSLDATYHPQTNAALASMEDRKSTRLNSSHSQISYAVFCLKKKN